MSKNIYKASKKKTGLFTYLENHMPFGGLFIDGLPSRYLPLVLYSFLLGLLYIGNTHYYEKNLRKAEKLEQEVEALRVTFTTLQSSYMLASKQSMVAQQVAALGLYESNKPPFKIVVPAHKNGQ